jgi:hypothetical protein
MGVHRTFTSWRYTTRSTVYEVAAICCSGKKYKSNLAIYPVKGFIGCTFL